MKCPNCGTENISGALFCQACGKAMPKVEPVKGLVCPRCQHVNPTDAKFCENCGQSLTVMPASSPSATDSTPTSQSSDAVTDESETNKAVASDEDASIETNKQPSKKPQTTAEIPTETTKSQPSKPIPTPQPMQRVTRKAAAKKSHLGLWVSLGVIVVILLVAGGWFFTQHQHQQQADTDTPTTKQSSSVSKAVQPAATSSSHTQSQKPALPVDQLGDIATNTITPVSGTNSIYVAKIGDSGAYVLNDHAQRAASDIKIFIMLTVYQQVSDGKLNLNQDYTVQDADKVGGTGVMQNMQAGESVPLQSVMRHMMQDSDNMAANVMIDQVGGLEVVNQEINAIGATRTVLARKLMDTDALAAGEDNMTSVKDLGMVLTKLYQHKLISPRYDNDMLDLMANDSNHTKLPNQIHDATVYNKTGEFAQYGVQNDAAIIHNNQGTMIAVVMQENGDEAAQIKSQSNFGAQAYQLLLNQ